MLCLVTIKNLDHENEFRSFSFDPKGLTCKDIQGEEVSFDNAPWPIQKEALLQQANLFVSTLNGCRKDSFQLGSVWLS